MIDLTVFYSFLIILARITAYLLTVSVLSSKGVPAILKIGLSFFITVIIFPYVNLEVELIAFDYNFLLIILEEVILGLVLGWITQLIFSSIQVAGSFIDIQNGMGMANVVDFTTGNQIPLLGNFKYALAVLLFFTLDIHYYLLDSIISSFEILPIAGEWVSNLNNQAVLDFIVVSFSQMFIIAFKIAAPIVVTLLLTDIGLGILSRTVPQLNVYVVGMPLKVLLNYVIMFFVAAGFIYMFKDVFEEMISAMKNLIEILRL